MNSDTPLLTVNQFAEKHPAFTAGALRYLIFHAESNGFRPALRKVGRRVLINEEAFFLCIEKSNQVKN